MSMQKELLFVVALGLVVLAANVWATVLVMRDSLSEPSQRMAQLLMVWLLPILGAVIVFAVHRSVEKPSGKYKKQPDPGDDFGFPRQAGRRTQEGADDD
jgi:hypothetical protein